MTSDSIATRTPLALMTQPPVDPAECIRIGEEIWTGLAIRYRQGAAPREIELLSASSLLPVHQREYQEAISRFDDYVLEQFSEWGWRLLLSREFLRIVARWEVEAPERLERLGLALAKKSKVYRREESAPLMGGVEVFADATIAELKIILRKMRNDFHSSKVNPRCDRIADWIENEVKSHIGDYPRLYGNLGQLCSYLRDYLPTRNELAARELEAGRMRAAGFFYMWYADATFRNRSDVENLISKRRKSSKKS
jgi:hypothetical protein